MALTFPDPSTQYLQDLLFYQLTQSNNLQARLFMNNATVSQSTVLSNLVEATFTGYMAIDLPTYSSWTKSGPDGNDRMVWTLNSPVSWTLTGTSVTNSIYGVYLTSTVVDNTVGSPPALYLVALQNLPSYPVSMTTVGDTITIQPILRMGSAAA